jgi:hypothetical protein
MAQKEAAAPTRKRAAAGKRKRSTKAGAKVARESSPLGPAAGRLRDVAGQTGSILKRILQLTDATVGLGVNLVSLLTSMTQAQIGGRVPPEEDMYAGGHSAAGDMGAAAGSPRADAAAGGESRAVPRSYCVANRTPLVPGGPIRIPFSINNDLPQTPKRLVVSAHDFTGATQGFRLDDAAFSVEPSEKVIAPMDFEKFVLTGAVPLEAPPDSYNGWILVGGDEQMKIPVVLMVSGAR